MSDSKLKLLQNSGMVTILSEEQCNTLNGYGTVVVLGAPRGGTSMVAGALHLMGIPMGDKLTDATYEDSAMISSIAKQDAEEITNQINKRNQQYPLWGWKQPVNLDYFFEKILPQLRNPILVAIYRDVLSIGNRNNISAGLDVLGNMNASLNFYIKMTQGISKAKVPAMLVSYEKAILHPDIFVRGLAGLLNIDNEQAIDQAVKFVEPSPIEYLIKSYIKDGRGHLDSVKASMITGWAFFKNIREPVSVNLYINGNLIMSTKAHHFRKDILQNKMHYDGHCGFVFRMNDKHILKNGDSVVVKIKGEDNNINNCPLIFKGIGDN